MSRYLMVLSLGGCAQLAGIDDTTGAIAPESVTLSIERFSIGATTVQAPLDLTGLTATYLELDPEDPTGFRRTAAELADPMTWAADVPEGTPAVLFTTPDLPTPMTRLYALGQRNVRSLHIVAEHPAPTAAPDGATIAATVTLDAAFAGNENFVFYTAGAWSQRPFVAPLVGEMTLAQTFPYAEATSLINRPLEKITAADAVLVLKYIGATLTGVLDLPGFDQTGTDTIAGAITGVAADQTVDVVVDPPAVANRFGAGRPAVAGLAMNWGMTAAPGSTTASTLGPSLTGGGIAADATQITASFGNPFGARGWPSTFRVTATMTRTFTPPALALPVTLRAELHEVTEASVGFDATLPAALPVLITIGATPILTDGIDLKLDLSKAVAVSFVTDKPGGTLFQLHLYELVPSADGTVLEHQHRVIATAATPAFELPPEFFVVGKTYTLRAICFQGGFPDLAAGNLAERQLPFAHGFFDSGVFTVVP